MQRPRAQSKKPWRRDQRDTWVVDARLLPKLYSPFDFASALMAAS